MLDEELENTARTRGWSDAVVAAIRERADALLSTPGPVAQAIASEHGLPPADELVIAALCIDTQDDFFAFEVDADEPDSPTAEGPDEAESANEPVEIKADDQPQRPAEPNTAQPRVPVMAPDEVDALYPVAEVEDLGAIEELEEIEDLEPLDDLPIDTIVPIEPFVPLDSIAPIDTIVPPLPDDLDRLDDFDSLDDHEEEFAPNEEASNPSEAPTSSDAPTEVVLVDGTPEVVLVDDVSAVLEAAEAPDEGYVDPEPSHGIRLAAAASAEPSIDPFDGFEDDASRLAAAVALCSQVALEHAQGRSFGNLGPDAVRFDGSAVHIDPDAPPDPEQPEPDGAGADVWALGALLIEHFDTPSVEGVLERAMSDDRRQRQADAGELLRDLIRAAAPPPDTSPAKVLLDAASQNRQAAKDAIAMATASLEQLPADAPEAERQPSWATLAEADRQLQDANSMELAAGFELLAAAAARPDLDPLQQTFADFCQPLHARLEAEDAAPATLRTVESLIERFDRGAHAAYLTGKGTLTLHTNRPVAVDLYRYELRDHRLWPTPVGALGQTPIVDVRLPAGSYVALLHDGERRLRVPLTITRLGHWNGSRTGEGPPVTFKLPDKLRNSEVWVPEGPFRYGGPGGLPERDAWLPGFIIQRYPVKMGDYLEFMAAMRHEQGAELARRYELSHPKSDGVVPSVVWSQGAYQLVSDSSGRYWPPEWPAVGMSMAAAMAYASWRSRRERISMRLPSEPQWEKAARGVDGRPLPFGPYAEPVYARYASSQPVMPEKFPADSSPYGVRGLAGNVSEWVIADDPLPPEGFKVVRGGAYCDPPSQLQSFLRRLAPDVGSVTVGFRLTRAV